MSTEPSGGNRLVVAFNRYGAEAVKSLNTRRKHRSDLPIIFLLGPAGASSSTIGGGDALVQLERPVQEAALIQAIQCAAEILLKKSACADRTKQSVAHRSP
jgi:FixJ family two-component response regulator